MAFHGLPFQALPPILLQYLVMDCAKKLNYFPPRGGISDIYSPHAIMHQTILEFDKHCGIPFGTYLQANDDTDPTNTQKPRTLDCLYIRNVENAQGGHEVFDIRTGGTCLRPRVTPLPITQNITGIVNNLAIKQGMKPGLKITTHTNEILYNSSLIAGVDYADGAVHADQDDPNQANNNDENVVNDEEEALDNKAEDNSEDDRSDIDINEDSEEESQADNKSNPTEVEEEEEQDDQVDDDDEQEDASENDEQEQQQERRTSSRPRSTRQPMNIGTT